MSARLGDDDTVLVLLEHGANVEAVMRDGYTPLHIAVKQQHLNTISLLLGRSARLDVKSKVKALQLILVVYHSW